MARKPPKSLEFKLSYETANALQSILTQQAFHVNLEGNEILAKEFLIINRFYEALTDFVEKN